MKHSLSSIKILYLGLVFFSSTLVAQMNDSEAKNLKEAFQGKEFNSARVQAASKVYIKNPKLPKLFTAKELSEMGVDDRLNKEVIGVIPVRKEIFERGDLVVVPRFDENDFRETYRIGLILGSIKAERPSSPDFKKLDRYVVQTSEKDSLIVPRENIFSYGYEAEKLNAAWEKESEIMNKKMPIPRKNQAANKMNTARKSAGYGSAGDPRGASAVESELQPTPLAFQGPMPGPFDKSMPAFDNSPTSLKGAAIGNVNDSGLGKLACAYDQEAPGIDDRMNRSQFTDKVKNDSAMASIKRAILKSDLKELKKALGDQNKYLEAVDENGDTPLLFAISVNKPAAVSFLLERGANPSGTALPLAQALGNGNNNYDEIITTLVLHGAADNVSYK
jgi:hypothetical protein